MARLDMKEALLCNPLVTLAWLLVPAVIIALEKNPKWGEMTMARVGLPAILAVAAAAVLINWILLVMLRHV